MPKAKPCIDCGLRVESPNPKQERCQMCNVLLKAFTNIDLNEVTERIHAEAGFESLGGGGYKRIKVTQELLGA